MYVHAALLSYHYSLSPLFAAATAAAAAEPRGPQAALRRPTSHGGARSFVIAAVPLGRHTDSGPRCEERCEIPGALSSRHVSASHTGGGQRSSGHHHG